MSARLVQPGVTYEKTLAYAIQSLPGHFGKANEPFY